MKKDENQPRIPLPGDWSRLVRSAMPRVISLAQCTGTPETAVFGRIRFSAPMGIDSRGLILVSSSSMLFGH